MTILEEWLPKNRVHLLGGPSDAGKTRYTLPSMIALGKPWVYVAGDRSLLDAKDTIMSLGLPEEEIRIIPAFGPDEKELAEVFMAVKRLTPLPEIVVIEGLQRLCPDRNRHKVVSRFLGSCEKFIQPGPGCPDGMTILGVCEAPKMKPHERYANPRDRISGSATWAYAASTVMMIDCKPPDWALEKPQRKMWVCMKNKPRLQFDGEFNENGYLTFVPSLSES